MAQKTSRSIGWRFQSSNKGAGLIQLNGHEIDTLDTQTLNQLTLQVQDLETEDVTIFLNIVPPVEQLIQQIPYSLPLLEAIYLKCELWHSEDGRSFPAKLLNCEQLFCQLVWWTAYCEQQNHNASLNKPIPTFQELEPCVGTVISVLYRQCPGLLERAQNDRKQLTVCLESFGCHGLVNCSSGLIRMSDAVHLEISRHVEKIKALCGKMKEVSDIKSYSSGIVDPSGASHQRQMSLRLSEVLERMKHNEKMESILEEAMNNNHLASLLRILRKRVASDRLLIGLFNAFTRAAPEDFSFNQLDPVIAKLIVVFNNAYEKLLSLCPPGDCDSGCSGDSSTEGGHSSNELHTSSSSQRANHHTRRYQTRRSSLHDLSTPSPSQKLKSAQSLSNLREIEMRRYMKFDQTENVKDDTLRLRLHVNHLKNELAHARKQIAQMMNLQHRGADTSQRLWPEPDYPDATSYYNCSSRQDVTNLIGRFSELFIRGRKEIMVALDKLPEFVGSEELQLKTILSIIVLTYRSVVDSVYRRRERIWDIIHEGEARVDCEESSSFDIALYRHMYRRAKSQHGIQNAKEVTSQIWGTLYDFPSLKTCTIFNRYILECVDVSWDLVAGIDGRYPRFRIEYEGVKFEDLRHSRASGSSSGEKIHHFLWPGLIDISTEKCLLKAIVLT